MPIASHILIQALIFLSVVFFLSHLVFKPVLRTLLEREARMTGDRETAKDLVKKAEERVKEYENKIYQAKSQAKEIKVQLLNTAAQKEREILNIAREESSKSISATRQRIQEEGRALMPELRKEAQQIATTMAGLVLGRNL